MKTAYMIAVVLGLLLLVVFAKKDKAENDYSQMVGKGYTYIGAGIKKVEIEKKYVCFVLLEYRGISCVQKVGE